VLGLDVSLLVSLSRACSSCNVQRIGLQAVHPSVCVMVMNFEDGRTILTGTVLRVVCVSWLFGACYYRSYIVWFLLTYLLTPWSEAFLRS